MRILRSITVATVAIAAMMVWGPDAAAYDTFTSPAGGCKSCHTSFEGFGAATHDMHLEMTSTCSRCHEVPGDTPAIDKCTGCHIAEGVRNRHRNVGTSTCGGCHSTTETSPPESTIPPYYGMADINIDHPCFTDPTGTPRGEDFDGDGRGLDNDGDLAHDFDDPDCEALPTQEATWGTIKALF